MRQCSMSCCLLLHVILDIPQHQGALTSVAQAPVRRTTVTGCSASYWTALATLVPPADNRREIQISPVPEIEKLTGISKVLPA